MSNHPTLALVPSKIFELCNALGVRDINQLPGAWTYQVDSQWRVAVNGQDHDVEIASNDDFMGATLPPYHIAVWLNGWLAGLMSPFDGIIAADKEDEFIAVLEKAIANAR